MKNIFLIIGIFFLCGVYGFGQNTKIEESDYNKLVEYVSCRYINQYINNYPNKSTAETSGYNVIQEAMISNKLETPIAFDSFKQTLKDNHWGTTAEKFETWKKAKKFSDISTKTNSEIIENIISITDPLKSGIKGEFIETIKKELLEKYPDSNTIENVANEISNAEVKSVKEDNGKLKIKLKDVPDNNTDLYDRVNDLEASLLLRKFVEILQWAIILSFIFYFFKIKLKNKSTDESNESVPVDSKTRENIIKTVLDSKRIASQFKPQIITKAFNNNTLDEKYINLIVDRVMEINRLDEAEKQSKVKKEDYKPSLQEAVPNQEFKYLKEREGLLLFKETTLEFAYYELFNISGNKASYRFCGNEERAIENYDAVLKDVFDDEKTYSLKTRKIIIGKEGSVELQPDGKWEIKTLAKIKFI